MNLRTLLGMGSLTGDGVLKIKYLAFFKAIFKLLMLLLVCHKTYADDVFLKVNETPLSIKKTYVLNRNHSVGLQHSTNLNFTQWLDIVVPDPVSKNEAEVTFGLTKNNRLYQVVNVEGTTFTRLLSGARCIAGFRIHRETQQLFAVTCDSKLYRFSHRDWKKSPWHSIIKKRGAYSLVGMTLVTMSSFAMAYHGLTGLEEYRQLISMYGSFFGSWAYLNLQTMLSLRDYGKSNRTPDGLVKTSFKNFSFDDLEAVSSEKFHALLAGQEDWQVNCDLLLKTKIPEELVTNYKENNLFL